MTITRRTFGYLTAGAGLSGALPGLAMAAEPAPAHGLTAFDPSDLKYPPDFEMFDYATPEGITGGTFSWAIGGLTFDSLNPYVLKGNPVFGLQYTTDSLMTGAADEPDSMYGLLAESVVVPEDRMYAAFTLREGARFRDGSPVTAEDVVFSFGVLREKGHPTYRVLLSAVEGARVDDMGRVRFDFRADAARRDLPLTVAGLPVFSKAFFETRDFGESTLEAAPMTSGPYEVDMDALEPGRTIVFRRRPDYWGWDLPVNRGRMHFDRIRIEYFRDRSVEFEAFKAQAFAFKEEFWSKMWATAYEPAEFPAVGRGEVVRDVLPDNRPSGTQGYWFNLRREKFSDIRVRHAIALCFDFEWSNETLFYGLYERTDSFFEGGPMEASGVPSPAERALLEPLADQLPDGILVEEAYVPPVSDGSGRNRRALRQAARLLDEAGWQIVDGLRRKDGQTLSIEFLENSPSFERITNPYVQLLRLIGVDATSRRVDPAQYERRVEEHDFDIIVQRKSMSLTPGVDLRDDFHSDSAEERGSGNRTGLSHPAVDRLIEVIEEAESREELTVAVKALDRVLRSLHIWVPQWNKGTHTLAYWDIFGRPPEERKPAYARGVIDLWWYDPDKAARFGDKFQT